MSAEVALLANKPYLIMADEIVYRGRQNKTKTRNLFFTYIINMINLPASCNPKIRYQQSMIQFIMSVCLAVDTDFSSIFSSKQPYSRTDTLARR